MLEFLSGAVMMGSVAASLFFLRFWKSTRDRLFFWFGIAFLMLAIERWVLVSVSPDAEFRFYVYSFRMVAFLLIGLAIVDKNRSSGER